MFATMLKRDRERAGLRIARASWLVGVTVREYRKIEAGTKAPDWDTNEPRSLLGASTDVRARELQLPRRCAAA